MLCDSIQVSHAGHAIVHCNAASLAFDMCSKETHGLRGRHMKKPESKWRGGPPISADDQRFGTVDQRIPIGPEVQEV